MTNQYEDDIQSGELYRELRAYAHDVRKNTDPFSDTYAEDVDCLLNLINSILSEHGIDPYEYTNSLDRGGVSTEEEEE